MTLSISLLAFVIAVIMVSYCTIHVINPRMYA